MIVRPTSFYQQDTIRVAQELLGNYLVLEQNGIRRVGRIIETEAYLGVGDRASHSSKGPTPRTQVLFGPAGIIYIYLIYGIYHCLNVVTDRPETGAAVLIRAVEPVANLEGKTSGPGLVCKAYGLDRTFNGLSISEGPLTIEFDPEQMKNGPVPFNASPRVGVDYAGEDRDKPYRFLAISDC